MDYLKNLIVETVLYPTTISTAAWISLGLVMLLLTEVVYLYCSSKSKK